jgi:Flp pilus assembly protein TadD
MNKLSALKPFVLLLSVLTFTGVFSQGVVTTPRVPSPAATVSQTIGISTVSVNYSRPSVKGREIWGALVPYGWNVQSFGSGNSSPWRAGANENTVITFSNDATVEGQHVPAGSYGLTFVINKDNTGEVVLSKDYKSWGSFFYDPKLDEMRAKIQVRDMNDNTEMLTYDFINVNKTSAELVLNWEKKQFPVKIEYDVDNIVMANAAEELKNTAAFSWQGYASAATYALENKVDYDQALVWANKAASMNSSFTTLSLKSELLRETGKTDEADKTMNDAIPLSTENELNNYGYQLMNRNQIDKAIEIFVLNTKQHPESANVWDSLGEAYVTKGDKKDAITSFKKSLSLNPPDGTKANSEKFLKQLGAM